MVPRFGGRRGGVEPKKAVREAEAPIVSRRGSHPIDLLEANPRGEEGELPLACHVEVAHHTVTNWGGRHSNEDRIMCHKDVLPRNSTDFHTVGVLDGHDSDCASDMVSRCLPPAVSSRLKAGDPVVEAYTATMADLESKLKEIHSSAGTCVLSCTIAGRYVWCANLGDCRAGLIPLEVSEGAPPEASAALPSAPTSAAARPPEVSQLVWVSRDHKASAPEEMRRISAAGGMVIDGRVEGLEPSRTLGDFDVKSQVKHDVISIVPEIRLWQLGNGTEKSQALLVCGTDGIWDVLTAQDVCDIINARKELAKLQACIGTGLDLDKQVLKDIAEDLVQLSLGKGSRDDCTAVVGLISVSPESAGGERIPRDNATRR
mmetsp:Transcript_6102/g.10990  ORF Transcript_6102/g.10990 Transcript_6102/m.10990 type:complete len:373 (-) Transcript_6102:137-1255(-)